MWESGQKEITEEVLARLDEALADKVYEKIWSELTPKERWFLGFIARKDTMPSSLKIDQRIPTFGGSGAGEYMIKYTVKL